MFLNDEFNDEAPTKDQLIRWQSARIPNYKVETDRLNLDIDKSTEKFFVLNEWGELFTFKMNTTYIMPKQQAYVKFIVSKINTIIVCKLEYRTNKKLLVEILCRSLSKPSEIFDYLRNYEENYQSQDDIQEILLRLTRNFFTHS